MLERLDIRVQRDAFSADNEIAVLFFHTSLTPGEPPLRRVVAPLTLEPHVPGMMPARPTFLLKPEEAQQMMDELWRAGVRPTEGAGSVGQMAATERHLQDMRRLVFDSQPTVTHTTTGPNLSGQVAEMFRDEPRS